MPSEDRTPEIPPTDPRSPKGDYQLSANANRSEVPKQTASDQDVRTTCPASTYPYTKVHALLMCWKDETDAALGELEKLRDVFSNTYHFEVEEVWGIPSDQTAKKVLEKLQSLGKSVAERNCLLIVGYVGHGRLYADRSYQIAARSDKDIPPWDVFDPRTCWSVIQDALQAMENDVLVLLDSCFSSGCITGVDTTKSKGKVEVITASGYSEMAFGPEKVRTMWTRQVPTFTRELVKQLKSKAETDQSFTAANLHLGLVQQIIHANFDSQAHGGVLPTPMLFNLGQNLEAGSILLKPFSEGAASRVYTDPFVGKLHQKKLEGFLEIRQNAEGRTGIMIDIGSSEEMEVANLLVERMKGIMQLKILPGNLVLLS